MGRHRSKHHSHHQSETKTYEFTAFTEEDLLNAGSGNGSNLGYGDTFTMPGCASVEFSVTDNDSRLSGDSRHNENANDRSGQQASITQDGQEIGNGGQIYAEKYMWVCDTDGNWYLMIEIEQEGGGDDFFVFHDAYGIPPAGAELTVSCGGNISCWEPKFEDLGAPEVKNGPEAVADQITIGESDTIGDATNDHQLNVLDNDSDAAVTLVNGQSVGTISVMTENGVTVMVTIDANGDLSFDTAGLFESLGANDSDRIVLSYTITDANGETAQSSVTINIQGENDGPVAEDNAYSTTENAAISGNIVLDAGVNGVDSDVDGDDLTVSQVTVNNAALAFGVAQTVTTDDNQFTGTLTVNDDGGYTFVPGDGMDALGAGESTTLTFAYTVTDGAATSNTATVTITVDGENDGPTAFNNAYAVDEDAAAGVIGNVLDDADDQGMVDSDPDANDTLSVVAIQVGGQVFGVDEDITVTSAGGREATISVSATGELTFNDGGNFDALNDGQSDTVAFEYVIEDTSGADSTASVTVQVDGQTDTETTEYNILFLVDASTGLEDSNAHGLFLSNPGQDLNGDGFFDSVLDAELATVQQYVDALGALGGSLNGSVEVGVTTFASTNSLFTPNDDPVQLVNGTTGGTIFDAGDDLSSAFIGAGGQEGTALWNTAIRGANEFFDATSGTADNVVNLLYVLSDSQGAEQTTPFSGTPDASLADELALLDANHAATIDTIIYNDADDDNTFLLQIDNTPAPLSFLSPINLVENQTDLDSLLGQPLQDNLMI